MEGGYPTLNAFIGHHLQSIQGGFAVRIKQGSYISQQRIKPDIKCGSYQPELGTPLKFTQKVLQPLTNKTQNFTGDFLAG